jgi:hypothetical protein
VHYSGKALTLKQPWAAALAVAGKDVENRVWTTKYRGPLAIHAGMNQDIFGAERQVDGVSVRERTLSACYRLGLPAESIWLKAHVIALVRLHDVLSASDSPWYIQGQYAWIVRDVVPIVPVPMHGTLGLWAAEFDYEVL